MKREDRRYGPGYGNRDGEWVVRVETVACGCTVERRWRWKSEPHDGAVEMFELQPCPAHAAIIEVPDYSRRLALDWPPTLGGLDLALDRLAEALVEARPDSTPPWRGQG